MNAPVRPPRREVSGPAFPGPLLMLFPLLFLVAAITYLSERSAEPGAVPVPPGGEHSLRIPAWLGQASGPGGEQLLVRLTHLHGNEEHQVFETQSLSRRLGLDLSGGSQPWRLELRYLGDSLAAPVLELSELVIRDEKGVALRPLPAPPAPPIDAVADPLAVLLAPPPRLAAGELARLVFWGREPGSKVVLEGCLGGIALHADQVEADDSRDSLASLSQATAPADSGEARSEAEDR